MINFTALIGFHLIYGYINSNGHKFTFRWYPSQTNKARSIVRFVDWIYTIEISGKLSIVMRKQMNFNRTNFHSFGYATWFEWFEWFFFLLLSAKTHFAPCIHHTHTNTHTHYTAISLPPPFLPSSLQTICTRSTVEPNFRARFSRPVKFTSAAIRGNYVRIRASTNRYCSMLMLPM